MQLSSHPDHESIVTASAFVPWTQLLAWLQKYGFPYLIQVLALVLPLLGGKKIDVTKLVTWIEAALVALAAGQQIPALPTL